MPRIIIANRLRDGRVVFLGPERHWVRDLARATEADSDAQLARLAAIAREAEADCVVVDPYPIEVEERDGARTPVLGREAIRAHGPSVPPAPGRARER